MKPAAKLPWRATPAVQNNGPNYYAIGTGKWGDDSAAHAFDAETAEYIVHACNMYPQLVEALSEIVAEFDRMDKEAQEIPGCGGLYESGGIAAARTILNKCKE
jgi:hypothetical protein